MITSDLIFALKTLFEFTIPFPAARKKNMRVSSVTWSLAELCVSTCILRAHTHIHSVRVKTHKERRYWCIYYLALPQASITIIFRPSFFLPRATMSQMHAQRINVQSASFSFFINLKMNGNNYIAQTYPARLQKITWLSLTYKRESWRKKSL